MLRLISGAETIQNVVNPKHLRKIKYIDNTYYFFRPLDLYTTETGSIYTNNNNNDSVVPELCKTLDLCSFHI